jgi:hypothetical protein
MWLVETRHLGLWINRGWPARKQGSAASRLVTVGANLRSGPSSLPQTGRNMNTTRGNRCGEQRPPGGRSTKVTVDTPPLARRRPRSSVMHRRRGGEARKRGTDLRGVTPGIRQYPSSAAGFRRRALFFEKPPCAKSERRRLLRSFRIRPLESLIATQAPTSPGPWEQAVRNNHAYGISCRTRPISTTGTRPDPLKTGIAWAVLRPASAPLREKCHKHPPLDDGLGLKSGLT